MISINIHSSCRHISEAYINCAVKGEGALQSPGLSKQHQRDLETLQLQKAHVVWLFVDELCKRGGSDILDPCWSRMQSFSLVTGVAVACSPSLSHPPPNITWAIRA
ncbi:unnamed protein product [Natator depressus]